MRTFLLTVHAGDADETDRLARRLQADLLMLDVDRVDLLADGATPPLAKGDPATVATIVVALAGSPVLIQLSRALRDWVNRGRDRRITVRDGDRVLEITGSNAQDNREAIESFFREIE